MTLGERIKIERTKKGFSQAALGELLQLTQQAVGRWEKNLSEPDSRALTKMANLFGVTVDELLGRESLDKEVIKRPPYDLSDRQLVDLMKLYEIMTEIQKAHVLGYIIAYLEREGVNVKKVLNY